MGLGLGNSVTSSVTLSGFSVANVSEVVTWLKADTGITEDSGSGLVGRWRDQVGTADWVQNATTNQPELFGSGINSRVRFDGTDRMYQKDYDWNFAEDGNAFDFPHDRFDTMNSGGSGGMSFFVVLEISSIPTSLQTHVVIQEDHFVDDGVPGSGFTARTDIAGNITILTKGDFFQLTGISAGSGSVFNSGTSAGTELPLSSNALGDLDGTDKFLLTIEYEGGTNGAITVRTNKVNKAMTTNNTATLGQMTVGQLGSNSNGLKGEIYELINCSSKVSSSDRDLIEDYLMTRHSIS
tara:strand:+ start:19 stop:903 length:885 start_codon:yes stop_codon:yes gene_type:complete